MFKFKSETIIRFFIVFTAIAVVLSTFGLSFSIANNVKEEEKNRIQLYAIAQELMLNESDENSPCDFTWYSRIQEYNNSIPVILTEGDFKIIDIINYENRTLEKDIDYIKNRLEILKVEGNFIKIETDNFIQYLFYDDSNILQQVKYYPYWIAVSVLSFILIILFYIWSLKRREQERIWVGMAKETAHQLGTPISSLIGWVDNLKATYENDDYIHMVGDEIGKDIKLLQIVAERFSKIGAIPELKQTNIVENLVHYHDYIKQRASRRIEFDFKNIINNQAVFANVNSLLFDWVLENLLKNALDAIEDGIGKITVNAYEEAHWVCIDISDTGKGMTPQIQKKIFEPGFSTKKRGWGLGLSLCKRIIEQYHRGRIFVHESALGQGTTFRILLPAINFKKAIAIKND